MLRPHGLPYGLQFGQVVCERLAQILIAFESGACRPVFTANNEGVEARELSHERRSKAGGRSASSGSAPAPSTGGSTEGGLQGIELLPKDHRQAGLRGAPGWLLGTLDLNDRLLNMHQQIVLTLVSLLGDVRFRIAKQPERHRLCFGTDARCNW